MDVRTFDVQAQKEMFVNKRFLFLPAVVTAPLCMAAGNGIVGGTPLENIDACLDETPTCGLAQRAKFQRPRFSPR
jgi:rubredoxin